MGVRDNGGAEAIGRDISGVAMIFRDRCEPQAFGAADGPHAEGQWGKSDMGMQTVGKTGDGPEVAVPKCYAVAADKAVQGQSLSL